MEQIKIGGNVYTQDEMVRNILVVFDTATQEDVKSGESWYAEAFVKCQSISHLFGVPAKKVAGIIAVFSPLIGWKQNVIQTIRFLCGDRPARMSSMIETAKLILDSDVEDVRGLLTKSGAKKVKSFYDCIVDGETDSVCVDRHAINVAINGCDFGVTLHKSVQKLSPKQYEFIAKCYRIAAEDRAVWPYEMQAITWCSHRRRNGIDKKY